MYLTYISFKKKREKTKTLSCCGRSVVLGICRRRKGAGIVFNIDVLSTGLEERACNSTKVELYNTEIKVGEVLSSVQPEVLEPSCIVLVQADQ